MASYILNISYTVKSGKREAFLSLSGQLKQHFSAELGKDYRIYEVKGRPNSFVEQFVCASKEEFDNLEDDLTEKGEDLVNQLSELVEDGTTAYSTLIEL